MEFNDRRRDVHERGEWTTFKHVRPGDRIVASNALFRNEQDARTSDVAPLTVTSAGHEPLPNVRYQMNPATGKHERVETPSDRKGLVYRAVDPSGKEQVWQTPGARRILRLPKESS